MSLFNQKMQHSNVADTASHAFRNVELIDFQRIHVEPIHRVYSPYQFSWNCPILFTFRQPLSVIIHWHLNVGFVRLEFSIDFRVQMDMIIKHIDIQDSFAYCETSETSTVLSDKKWILHPIIYLCWHHYAEDWTYAKKLK